MTVIENKLEDKLSKSLSLVKDESATKDMVQLNHDYVSVPINYICRTTAHNMIEETLLKSLASDCTILGRESTPNVKLFGLLIHYNSATREPVLILKVVQKDSLCVYGKIVSNVPNIYSPINRNLTRMSDTSRSGMPSLESLSESLLQELTITPVETHHFGFIDDAGLNIGEHHIYDVRFYWVNSFPQNSEYITVPVADLIELCEDKKMIKFRETNITFSNYTICRILRLVLLHPDWNRFIAHIIASTNASTNSNTPIPT